MSPAVHVFTEQALHRVCCEAWSAGVEGLEIVLPRCPGQQMVTSTILALGEAAVLAERSGLDLTELVRLLGGGYAGSRILESRGDRIIQQDYSPSGVAKYMVKDLDFASAVAAAIGTHPVLLPAVRPRSRN